MTFEQVLVKFLCSPLFQNGFCYFGTGVVLSIATAFLSIRFKWFYDAEETVVLMFVAIIAWPIVLTLAVLAGIPMGLYFGVDKLMRWYASRESSKCPGSRK